MLCRLKVLESKGYINYVWSDNKLYVNHMNELAIKYSTISGTEPVLYTEIEQLIEKGINKILWYDDVEIEELERVENYSKPNS